MREVGNQKRKEVIMSMKKMLSFALCLAFVLTFVAGCPKPQEKPATPPEAAQPAPPAQPATSSVKAPEAPKAPEAGAKTPEKPAEKK